MTSVLLITHKYMVGSSVGNMVGNLVLRRYSSHKEWIKGGRGVTPVVGRQQPSGHPPHAPRMPRDHPDPPPSLHPLPQALPDWTSLDTARHPR